MDDGRDIYGWGHRSLGQGWETGGHHIGARILVDDGANDRIDDRWPNDLQRHCMA